MFLCMHWLRKVFECCRLACSCTFILGYHGSWSTQVLHCWRHYQEVHRKVHSNWKKLFSLFLYTVLAARVMDCDECKLPLAYCPQTVSCKTSLLLIMLLWACLFHKAPIWCVVLTSWAVSQMHICRSSGLVHSKACNSRRSEKRKGTLRTRRCWNELWWPVFDISPWMLF